jgi:protein-S-isoprenylcysteine O-methyltransferase Ste14
VERRIIANVLTIILLILLIVKQVMNYRFDVYYAAFILPYLLSNTAALIMLSLSLKNRPKEVFDSGWLFSLCLIAANLPVIVNLSGIDLTTSGEIHMQARSVAAVMSVSVAPVYIYAILSLGRNLTVLPEANELRMKRIYDYARHPLYSIYIYWYVMQVFLFQSALILVLSVTQISFQIIRARQEEKVLLKNFPEYADYEKRVWWFGKNPFYKEKKTD